MMAILRRSEVRVAGRDREPPRKEKATRTRRVARALCRVNSACAGPLGALLDLELDLLTADEAIEVKRGVEAAAMEEVFLRILSGDEAEAAVGDDLLDGSGGHMDLQDFPNRVCRTHGPFEKG